MEAEYQAYLERFHAVVGEVPVGGFAKFKGQLVQKLSFDEYRTQRREYGSLHKTYSDAMLRGDTINDMVVRLLREHAARLIEQDPVDL